MIAAFLTLLLAVVHADTESCISCQNILNQQQCSVYFGCYWLSGSCQGQVVYLHSNQDDGSCDKLTDSCYGQDGLDKTQRCTLDPSSSCVAVPANMPCSTYNTSNFCSVNYQCFWTQSGSLGSCNPHQCGDFQTAEDCAYYVTQASQSATACKWTGYVCQSGQASDIVEAKCKDIYLNVFDGVNLFNTYYTYNDKLQVCTECKNTTVTLPTPKPKKPTVKKTNHSNAANAPSSNFSVMQSAVASTMQTSYAGVMLLPIIMALCFD